MKRPQLIYEEVIEINERIRLIKSEEKQENLGKKNIVTVQNG